MTLSTRYILSAALLFVANTASAVDGVIEINDVRAAAGNVTPGDGAGYPITISEAGSYRLTSNLMAPDQLIGSPPGAIEITADDVTIDLNGFAIFCQTHNVPGGGGVTMTTSCGGDGDGIYGGGGRSGITIKNGVIRNMGRYGINLPSSFASQVQNVQVFQCDNGGISVGEGSTIASCVVRGNGGIGIAALGGSVVTGNTCTANTGNGIDTTSVTTISGNAVFANGGDGIFAGAASLVIGNAIRSNTGAGIHFTSSNGGFRENTLDANTPQRTGGTDLGNNYMTP